MLKQGGAPIPGQNRSLQRLAFPKAKAKGKKEIPILLFDSERGESILVAEVTLGEMTMAVFCNLSPPSGGFRLLRIPTLTDHVVSLTTNYEYWMMYDQLHLSNKLVRTS